MNPCSRFAMLAIVVVGILLVGETRAQVPDCAQNLIPCASYLNSTNPPDSCCTPLRQAIATQRDCLCNLYNNPSLLQSLGINVTQALGLPKYCNASADTNLCSQGSAPPPTTNSVTPPATPGKDDSGAGKMAWTGASGLLLFLVSMMA